MKAIKDFKYFVNGCDYTEISSGDDIPAIAQSYALKNGYAEKADKLPLNKAKTAPKNKSKSK